MSTTNNERAALIDLIAEHLSGTYHCNRVWSAWNVGTMSEDDFSDVSESDTPAELADAILVSLAANAPAAPTHAAQRDELLQAAIDFIGTLTGMTPPPIEVAPPVVFAPFYEFVDRVQAITGAAPPAPTEQWMPIESAPKTHKARLVWCPEYRNIYEVTWCEHKLAWIHFGHGNVMTDTATHWREMPAPPQGAAKGNGNG